MKIKCKHHITKTTLYSSFPIISLQIIIEIKLTQLFYSNHYNQD